MARLDGSFQRQLENRKNLGFVEFAKGIFHGSYCCHYEDFLAAAGATLPNPWAEQDTSAGGTPVTDYVDDARNGQYELTHDGTSEAQTMSLYWGDQLMIPATKKFIFECSIAIDFAGATFSADQRAVWGVASARNATLNDVAKHAWFRVEGANLDLLIESDDGTTDDDDNDSGINIVNDTFHQYLIDGTDTSQIMFYANVGNGWQIAGALAAGALAVTDLLQPFIEIQRDAGTEAEQLLVDYVGVAWER